MANFSVARSDKVAFAVFSTKKFKQINKQTIGKIYSHHSNMLMNYIIFLIFFFCNNLKKYMTKQQIWTLQQDQMLLQLHKQAGCFQRWKFISAKLKEKGILKTQFQCRDRFINHLDPDLKLGKLTKPEIVKLFECYDQYGPRWSFFQTKIKGRSQNMLKNQFYSTLRSLLRLLIKIGHKKNLYTWKIQSVNYSSKLLADLYQGRKDLVFYIHKNFFRSCLKNIGCSVEKQFLQNYLTTVDLGLLKSFYQLIYEQISKSQSNGDTNHFNQLMQLQNIKGQKNNGKGVDPQNRQRLIQKQGETSNGMMITGLIFPQNSQYNNQWNFNNLVTLPISYSNGLNAFSSEIGYNIYYYHN